MRLLNRGSIHAAALFISCFVVILGRTGSEGFSNALIYKDLVLSDTHLIDETLKETAIIEEGVTEQTYVIHNKQNDLKPWYAMTLRDCIGLSAATVGLILAAGGGIGGGGILVPIYILIMDYPVKIAIPLSSVTVLGGAISNNILNARKHHPEFEARSLIDWDLILQIVPPAMAGALIGASLNDFLPEVALVVLLLALLSFTAYKTLQKACKLYKKETIMIFSEEQKRKRVEEYESILEKGKEVDSKASYGTIESTESSRDSEGSGKVSETPEIITSESEKNGYIQESSFDEDLDFGNHSIWSAFKLAVLFLVVTVSNLMEKDSIFGPSYHCDVTCTWIWQGAILSVTLMFCYMMRRDLLYRLNMKIPIPSDILWDETTTIIYPAFSIVAGLVAGLFGIGGGIVYGPLMLALGVHPEIASATSACMILFTSSTATVSYIVLGSLVYDYGLLYLILGLVSTLIGQTLMAYLVEHFQRSSYVAFCIGIVVAISAVCMSVESVLAIIS